MSTVAEVITDRFIHALEGGTVPWQQPWQTMRPYNIVSKKPYHGVNMLMLGISGFSDPRWATFNQIKGLGGTVVKGQSGMPIVFFKMIPDKKDEEGKRTIPLLKYTTAFNVTQTDGLTLPPLGDDRVVVSDGAVEHFVSAAGIDRIHGSAPAYSPSQDVIIIPDQQTFISDESYYSTLFHEMIHATGHESRCRRFESVSSSIFASESYSKEELTAEIGASVLRMEFAIDSPYEFHQSVAYVAGWIRKFKEEPNLIMSAARKAEDGVAWLLKEAEEAGDARRNHHGSIGASIR